MLFFIFLTVVLVALGYFLYKKNIGSKPKHVPVIDPKAQEQYNQLKQEQKDEEVNLSLEEKIELSWKFLVNIKDKVLNKFSAPDQKKVSHAGQKMLENGMKYEHNIDQEILIFSQNKAKGKTKKVSQARSTKKPSHAR